MLTEFNTETNEFVIYNSTKRCRKCGVVRDESCFTARRQNRDGLYSYCNECNNAASKIRYAQNREAAAIRGKEYYSRIKDNPRFLARLKDYRKKRRITDTLFRISQNMRGRVRSALSRAGVTKTNKFHDLLGCTPRQAVFHLTQGGCEIPVGMQVDHHIPVTFFDLSKNDHQKVCFNWRNLRLLSGEQNRKKSGRLPADYRERLTEICQAIGVVLT